MTLKELRELEREYLTADQIAGVLGSDPQTIRTAARADPQRLGFPVIVIGSRVKIPRVPFLRYMGADI